MRGNDLGLLLADLLSMTKDPRARTNTGIFKLSMAIKLTKFLPLQDKPKIKNRESISRNYWVFFFFFFFLFLSIFLCKLVREDTIRFHGEISGDEPDTE